MVFAKIINGSVEKYPYSLADLRADNPDTSFSLTPSSEALKEFAIFEVAETEAPTVSAGQIAEEAGPVFEDGEWRQAWTVRNRTAQELADAKEAKWEDVKARRDVAIDAGCSVPGVGVFDTDLVSRTNINGAATGAVIAAGAGQPFSVDWKLADNTIVALDGPGMIGVGMAILARTSACHAHAQQLGIAITDASSFADLASIDIEAGWPE